MSTASFDSDEDDNHKVSHQETPTNTSISNNKLPSKVIVTVGTYDGVLAGWELKQHKNKNPKLELSFATPVHGGSVRSLCFAAVAGLPDNKNNKNNEVVPGSLLSTGYDEMLKTHDWHRRMTSSGEVRTPAEFGTPVCASFAPPFSQQQQQEPRVSSTHCLVGFTSGKLVIYKKRDWTVQHVLAGHVGGVASLAVHPTGKLALTGGISDGKLKLWDLTKGRLSFATKISASSSSQQPQQRHRRVDPIISLVWSHDGSMYGFCHGSHITVRDVATGLDWCNVELPGRVNQLALISGAEGIFVAAACNDGSLPVLAVKTMHDEESNQPEARRAILAIEPVEGPVAGEERYKCIHTIAGYHVATANSAGVVSLMNLEGAVRMIMTGDNNNNNDDKEGNDQDKDENPASDDESDEEELAVDILDAVQLGTGARITCLVAWACDDEPREEEDEIEQSQPNNNDKPAAMRSTKHETTKETDKKRKLAGNRQEVEMDPDEVEKARALVLKAKQMEKRKDSKRRKVSPGE